MTAENSNRSILKTYTSTRRNTFTLVALQSFSISRVISAEKIKLKIGKITDVCKTGGMHYNPQGSWHDGTIRYSSLDPLTALRTFFGIQFFIKTTFASGLFCYQQIGLFSFESTLPTLSCGSVKLWLRLLSCDKHIKTHQKRWNTPTGWQKPAKVGIFSLFYFQKAKFNFIARFYSSLNYKFHFFRGGAAVHRL